MGTRSATRVARQPKNAPKGAGGQFARDLSGKTPPTPPQRPAGHTSPQPQASEKGTTLTSRAAVHVARSYEQVSDLSDIRCLMENYHRVYGRSPARDLMARQRVAVALREASSPDNPHGYLTIYTETDTEKVLAEILAKETPKNGAKLLDGFAAGTVDVCEYLEKRGVVEVLGDVAERAEEIVQTKGLEAADNFLEKKTADYPDVASVWKNFRETYGLPDIPLTFTNSNVDMTY